MRNRKRSMLQGTLLMVLVMGVLVLGMTGCDQDAAREYQDAKASLTAAVATATAARQSVIISQATQAVYSTQVDQAYAEWKHTEAPAQTRSTLALWGVVCVSITLLGLMAIVVMPRALYFVARVRIEGHIRRDEALVENLQAQKENLEFLLETQDDPPPDPRQY